MSPSGSDPDLLRRVAGEIRRKQDLEQGLGVARRRQMVMLPSAPKIDGYEFACTYDPATDISGDFYDFVRLGEGRVGVLVGDVSGHGVEAAIVMGMAKKALSIFARHARTKARPAKAARAHSALRRTPSARRPSRAARAGWPPGPASRPRRASLSRTR